ncbi:archaea-specific SMC-related protein [Haloarchaeobius baliensis]|uniref:archaea-specific SMC-related protein n=1 Tax=Haloarchaeobius baliensis TaxID=1670458 RepID=UPI003F882251
MSQSSQQEQPVRLSVENIGGISETTVTFERGVNVLSGRNATNRTSLLRAIMAALGSDDVSLKRDADEGSVELDIDGETYTRRVRRVNGSVVLDGEPYLDDPELADLFAFLLTTNETRTAVLTEQDLREIIMRPVDTTAIKREIESSEEEKLRVDEELEELAAVQQRLPKLEGERATLTDRIEETEAELAAKREELADAEATVDESRSQQRAVDEKMSELGDVRSDLESVRQELRAQRESLDSLQADHDELTTAESELPDSPAGEIEEIDAQIDDLRAEKQSLQSELNALQRVIQFNEDQLEGAGESVLEDLVESSAREGSGNVTDELVEPSESVMCWTCGREADREHVEATLERLRELRQSKLQASGDLDDRIDELSERRIEFEEKQRQREQVKRRLHETEARIDSREERIEELVDRRETLEEEIAEIEETVEAMQTQNDDTVLTLHKEANQLEVDLNQLERERREVVEEIETMEAELERRAELRERRAEVTSRLTDLRTRIDQIESEAVAAFNEHMETVLSALEYENLARIWIERVDGEGEQGRRAEEASMFALHIVRESEDGAAYEDELGHLSESEREVTGLVFALAGYLVHDVHEEVPFMLLDSVEAIDSDRIARLIRHFESYPDYLVAALLPEDAAATDDEYPVVTEI